MIDYFTIALTHGLIALAVFRLLMRDELDHEGPPAPKRFGHGGEGAADNAADQAAPEQGPA